MIPTQTVKVNWQEMPKGITWYFIGAPKTWKTTQAAKWSEKGPKGVLVLDTDLGTDFANNANRISVTSLNPPERQQLTKDGMPVIEKGIPMIEIVPPEERGYYHRVGPDKGKPMAVYSMAEVVFDLLEDFDAYGIDTIVIDTMDMVNEWIEDAISPEGMGSKGYGQDWSQARKKNLDIMLRLQSLCKQKGADLVLISHSKKTIEIDGKVQLMPDLPSGLANRFCAKSDVIGYTTINKDTGNAEISFAGYDERSVGSRLKPLSGKTLPFSYEAIKTQITGYKE